jgi:hypothetical protein
MRPETSRGWKLGVTYALGLLVLLVLAVTIGFPLLRSLLGLIHGFIMGAG